MKWNPKYEGNARDNTVACEDIFPLVFISVSFYVTACLIANYSAEVRLCPFVTCDLYNEVSVMSALINFRFVLTRS